MDEWMDGWNDFSLLVFGMDISIAFMMRMDLLFIVYRFFYLHLHMHMHMHRFLYQSLC